MTLWQIFMSCIPTQSRFICDTRGAGAGQLTVRIRGPKGKDIRKVHQLKKLCYICIHSAFLGFVKHPSSKYSQHNTVYRKIKGANLILVKWSPWKIICNSDFPNICQLDRSYDQNNKAMKAFILWIIILLLVIVRNSPSVFMNFSLVFRSI